MGVLRKKNTRFHKSVLGVFHCCRIQLKIMCNEDANTLWLWHFRLSNHKN